MLLAGEDFYCFSIRKNNRYHSPVLQKDFAKPCPLFLILVGFALKTIGGNMKRPSLLLAALPFLFAACQGQEYVYGGERAEYYTMLESQVKDTAFVKFLRDRGVKMETDANGLLRIYVHRPSETIPAVVTFLGLMKTRMRVITENLANVDTIRDAKGNPYRRKDILIDKDGNASVVNDETSPGKRYIPGHPDADEKGYVSFPNISVNMEIIKLAETTREYYLAERLLERCLPGNYIPDYSVQILRWNAEHLWEIDEYRDRLDRIERKLDALKPAM
jgi:flagellar basal-body rod protein FlgC